MTGNEIKELRQRLGLSIEDMAAKLGVVYTTLSAWERGIHSPSKRSTKDLLLLEIKMKRGKVK